MNTTTLLAACSSNRSRLVAAAAASLLVLSACGDDTTTGTGDLTVLLEAEDTITGGLDPGQDVENVRDGWEVRYDEFIVTIGSIDVRLSADASVEARDDEVFVVDLTTAPESGLPLWQLDDLRAGRWEFNFSTPGAAAGATRHDSVSAADFEQLQSNDWSYLIRGKLSQTGGKSCPPNSLAAPPAGRAPNGSNRAGDSCYDNPAIAFDLGASAVTHFGPCELDGIPGFSIASGSTQTVTATIHGDHIFFNGFPEGGEGGVLRLAQWLADSDLNLDGAVTPQELQAIAPSQLSDIDSRYQLGGSPITPLNTMWDYFRSQLETQGHMNGEGECPFNGISG
jgi:hypothetical protein